MSVCVVFCRVVSVSVRGVQEALNCEGSKQEALNCEGSNPPPLQHSPVHQNTQATKQPSVQCFSFQPLLRVVWPPTAEIYTNAYKFTRFCS